MSYQVYMLDPKDTDSSGSFGRELTRRLKSQYGLNVVTVTSDDGSVPMLLLCHNYSRIGTDIDSAASKLRGSDQKNVAVLVIHVREPHALPSTNPTENLYDAKYDNFGRLVDFAFSNSTGIYGCRMNTDADRKLKDFLSKYVDISRYVPAPRVPDYNPHPDGIWSKITRQKCICLIIVAAVVVVIIIILLATLL